MCHEAVKGGRELPKRTADIVVGVEAEDAVDLLAGGRSPSAVSTWTSSKSKTSPLVTLGEVPPLAPAHIAAVQRAARTSANRLPIATASRVMYRL
jgi:hypothetical protein